MDDLAAFLAARYDEAERTARAAAKAKPDGEEWRVDPDNDNWLTGTGVLSPDGALAMVIGSYAAAHIADMDPAHRLRDIALKRAILAEHEHVREDRAWSGKTDLDGPFGCTTCDFDSEYGQCAGGWCATVRHLGTEFSEHPDYKQEWAP